MAIYRSDSPGRHWTDNNCNKSVFDFFHFWRIKVFLVWHQFRSLINISVNGDFLKVTHTTDDWIRHLLNWIGIGNCIQLIIQTQINSVKT